MRRYLALPLALLLVSSTLAQTSTPNELEFVERLRQRGYPELALEYLETRLARDPRYRDTLPLEIARTRLLAASKQENSKLRAEMFNRARQELDDFIKKNPQSPRLSEARAELSRVATLQARVQLQRALVLPPSDPSRDEEIQKAARLIDDAAKQLADTAAKLPNPEARNEAVIDECILLLEKAKTIARDGDRSRFAAAVAKRLEGAVEALPEKNRKRGLGYAWAGYARYLTGEFRPMRTWFAKSRATNEADARRLTAYFELLADLEDARRKEPANKVRAYQEAIRAANLWRQNYRAFLTEPEGQGVLFTLAQLYYELGALLTGSQQNAAWNQVSQIVAQLEQAENEYTDRAYDLKIKILATQKVFDRPIEQLITFDHCFMRAIREHQKLYREAEKFEGDKNKEARKKQQELVLKCLQKALTYHRSPPLPPQSDVDTVRFMITGYHLSLEDLAGAARTGKAFAMSRPGAKQAPTAAMYAARAFLAMLKKDGVDAEGNDDPSKLPNERREFLELVKFMALNFPDDQAGEFGRFHAAQALVRVARAETDEERKARREEEAIRYGGDWARLNLAFDRIRLSKWVEALRLLQPIGPDFPAYILARYQMALIALKLDEENEQAVKVSAPLVEFAGWGKPPRTFRVWAQQLLESLPEFTADDDPETRVAYLRGKVRLAALYYALGEFDRMETLCKKLAEDLKAAKLDEKQNPASFEAAIETNRLYAIYGKTDRLFKAHQFKNVIAILEPEIKAWEKEQAARKPSDPTFLSENPGLRTGLLGMLLRSHVLEGRTSDAEKLFKFWKVLVKNDSREVSIILTQAVQGVSGYLELLRKDRNPDKLRTVIERFEAFLNTIKASEKNLTPDFIRLMATCYSGIDKHDKAIELLKSVPDPMAGPNDPATRIHRIIQIMLIRELRQNYKLHGKKDDIDEALKRLADIMGSGMKPGWGRQDMLALIEEIHTLIDAEAYGAAVNRADALHKVLQRKYNDSPAFKQRFWEVGQLFVRAYALYANSLTDKKKQDEAWVQAATIYLRIEGVDSEMGGADSRKQYQALFSEFPALKQAYDRIKK